MRWKPLYLINLYNPKRLRAKRPIVPIVKGLKVTTPISNWRKPREKGSSVKTHVRINTLLRKYIKETVSNTEIAANTFIVSSFNMPVKYNKHKKSINKVKESVEKKCLMFFLRKPGSIV